MGDDVLAERSPQEVAAWYGRLADLIDQKQIDNEKPIAPWALRGWLANATDQADFRVLRNPPKHLRESTYVLEVLDYHRAVYLTEKKARVDKGEKWAGIIPRLQGRPGFKSWDGTGTLDLEYQSLVEIPISVQLVGSDGDKDLLYALHGFQLHTEVTAKLTPGKSNDEKTVHFEKFNAYAEDVYDWDPSKSITVPNPDYQSTSPGAIAPSSEKVKVYHSNAKRIERAGLAKPYRFWAGWDVTIDRITNPAIINPNKKLGS